MKKTYTQALNRLYKTNRVEDYPRVEAYKDLQKCLKKAKNKVEFWLDLLELGYNEKVIEDMKQMLKEIGRNEND